MQNRGGGALSLTAMNKCLDKLIKNSGLSESGITRISLIRIALVNSYRAGMRTTDLMIVTGFSAETISTILAMDVAQYSPIVYWFVKRKADKVKRLESLKIAVVSWFKKI
ncbi:hypothetical protein H5185_04770 [Shewanella sp. SG44-6]|uniref:hypothetical protein n=1 Tax=Shewanella sp. SG44-6 TaxID=2760959 RepID=UPI0016004D45|nr:hypothetical protein [Shewanella sp. SG44-6]MBB1388736.1 hypothetical protein [Shewanella sp. SG44-6]